jgi:hypothetical protein
MLNFSKKASLAKNQVEQIQKKKTEYKLLGSYRRSKGLKLFSYNVITKEVLELHITYSNEAHLFHNGEVLDWFDPESSRTNIDSRNIHFEALNLRTAAERVRKFQQGKIKDLFNLKPKANSKLIF